MIRQRRAPEPLYDLHIAARRTFWVAACAGLIVFGTLMGAMFIGQQFLQNVLDYSTVEAGAAILPAAILMVLTAPRSAKLVETKGARFTLLVGYACCLLGFLTMLLLWDEGADYWQVGLGYALVGAGVGFAGTPASHSLTGSVPVTRAGMASGTADLQRDLGGAIMQSILGASSPPATPLRSASAVAGSPDASKVTDGIQSQLQKSFSSAEAVADAVPAVREPDHRGGQDVVPRRRRLGVHGRDRRDPARRHARVLHVPEAGRRGAPAGRVRREDTAASVPQGARLRARGQRGLVVSRVGDQPRPTPGEAVVGHDLHQAVVLRGERAARVAVDVEVEGGTPRVVRQRLPGLDAPSAEAAGEVGRVDQVRESERRSAR